MTPEEKIQKANIIRGRDRFGAMTEDEVAALPGTEREMSIPVGDRCVRVYELHPDREPMMPCALLINYHGGGFIKGRSDRDRRYCSTLAEQLGCVVWDVDYCLAPEAPFPLPVTESYGVAAYAFEHAAELGFDPARIAFAGHSAGGNLVHAAMLMDAGIGKLSPCCLLTEYCPVDQTRDPARKLTGELAGDPWWQRRALTEAEYAAFYADPDQLSDPLCSPLLAAPGAFAKLPPVLIISAGKDTLLTEVEEMASRLIAEGVEVTACRIGEAMHGFTVNRTEGWERALALHCKFLRQYL